LFCQQEVKVVGEESKGVEGDRELALMFGLALLGGKSLGGQAGDPGQRRAIREADIVGEGEDEALVVGLITEERLVQLGAVHEVVGLAFFEVAKEEFTWHVSTMTKGKRLVKDRIIFEV
jgi:hypothetical protein